MKKTGLFLVLFFGLSAFAQKSDVKIFVTLSPAGDFIAKTSDVKGFAVLNPDGSYTADNVIIDVKTLKTGLSLRDDHMLNKYLEVSKFPQIVLKKAKGANNKGEGILAIKGKEIKVAGTYKASAKTISAEFMMNLKDAGIEDISYKGVGVEDEIKIVAEIPIEKPAVKPSAMPGAKPGLKK